MKCEACEAGDHLSCGMQTWCECDCAGPDSIEVPDPMYGHLTFDTGERDADGFPKLEHVSLRREDAETIWRACEEAQKKRAEDMPDEQSALNAMFRAWQRLKELGWREGIYCPRDGTHFRTIEVGSTGIADGVCEGVWPNCTWTTFDEHDAYPSSQAPALFRLYPDDEAKYKAKMAEAAARFAADQQNAGASDGK